MKKSSIETELHEAKLKVTPARIGALSLFRSLHSPIDTAELIQKLQSEGIFINKTTAFRMMQTFQKANLIRQI